MPPNNYYDVIIIIIIKTHYTIGITNNYHYIILPINIYMDILFAFWILVPLNIILIFGTYLIPIGKIIMLKNIAIFL